ncbi:MAG: hypothetical protein R3A48_27450 [Polyangiales bacterium]
MFKRLLIGLLKGLVLGGAVGAALTFGLKEVAIVGVAAYALYALLGGFAGVLAGRPFWVKGAWVESLLKGLFGLAVGAGLYALASRFLAFPVPSFAGGGPLEIFKQPMLMAPGVGAIYAALVELDNTGEEEPEPTGVRIRSIDDIKIDEDEEVEAASSKSSSKRRA